jgi:hypothetical protein
LEKLKRRRLGDGWDVHASFIIFAMVACVVRRAAHLITAHVIALAAKREKQAWQARYDAVPIAPL